MLKTEQGTHHRTWRSDMDLMRSRECSLAAWIPSLLKPVRSVIDWTSRDAERFADKENLATRSTGNGTGNVCSAWQVPQHISNPKAKFPFLCLTIMKDELLKWLILKLSMHNGIWYWENKLACNLCILNTVKSLKQSKQYCYCVNRTGCKVKLLIGEQLY